MGGGVQEVSAFSEGFFDEFVSVMSVSGFLFSCSNRKTYRHSLVVIQIPDGLFEIADTTVNQLCTLTTGTGTEVVPLDNGHL